MIGMEAPRAPAGRDQRPPGLGLPLAMFLVVLVASLGAIWVLFGVARSVEAFVHLLATEPGVYLLVCSVLEAAGAAIAYRAYRSERSSRGLLLGVAVSLSLADLAMAAVRAPPESGAGGLLRSLPFLAPGHAMLLLSVAWHCRRGSSTRT